jgi:Arc/MetJ-type ribon-helix-helix transcriptional regulator
MPTVNVYLSDREYEALLELVRRSGRQRGELIREAVRALLEREGALRA